MFWIDVQEAMRIAANNGFAVDGRVPDESAYTGEVARVLRGMGLCATNGLPDEVWVTAPLPVSVPNSFSEHFDIVTSWGEVWDLYAARCVPAAFGG